MTDRLQAQLLQGLGRAVLDALPGLGGIVDADGRVVVTNARWERGEPWEGFEDVQFAIGDDVLERVEALRPRLHGNQFQVLDELIAGLRDVLSGRVQRAQVIVDHPRGHREFAFSRLPDPIGGALILLADPQERSANDERLAFALTHDRLTALPNRSLFLDRVAGALARPARPTVTVIHVDLDRFRNVNALVGSANADDVLARVARRFAAALRTGESIGRLGDDAFAVVSEVLDDETEAVGLAARLLARLDRPFEVAGQDLVLTASIGVARAGEHELVTARDLVRDAELASNLAKERGGAQVALAHHALLDRSAHRAELEQGLRRAFERDELRLAFQPEVSLESGRVVGAEALVRWQHPDHGELAPATFIGLAEETGLIRRLGEWVLRQACGAAAGWDLPADETALYVAVNVSAHQLADAAFVESVGQILAETGLPASRLCLEVTESVMLSQLATARETLAQLRERGVRIALDDFGTGYASFEYLLRLPIDLVKLDASFVSRLVSDPHDRAVVEAMIGLAGRLGLQLVAEGVEDPAQRAALAALGCDVVQGFDTGRPGDESALLGAVWSRAVGVPW
jgi:diguanylate cyclase (GGDEF)-like protein